jgi:hypothetical protein
MSPHSIVDSSIQADERPADINDFPSQEDSAAKPLSIFNKGIEQHEHNSLPVRPLNGSNNAFELEDHPIDATTPLRVGNQ